MGKHDVTVKVILFFYGLRSAFYRTKLLHHKTLPFDPITDMLGLEAAYLLH